MGKHGQKVPISAAVVIMVSSLLLLLHLSEPVGGVSVEEDLTLTYQEKMALDKFKVRMLPKLEKSKQYMKEDIYLIRWLRARNLNVDQAEQMLLENLKWRERENIDTIEDEDWSYFKAEYPYTNVGVDREGRPIGSFHFGLWDFRQAWVTGKGPKLVRYMTKLLEEATQRVIEYQGEGKNVTQWKVIMNIDGFNIVQHACPRCLPGYASFQQTYENHYAGFADALVLINTPPAFEIVLQVIRPIFTPPTQRALKVFGVNQKQWNEYLDNEISEDQRKLIGV